MLFNAGSNASLSSTGIADASGLWQVPFPAQEASRGWTIFATTSDLDEKRCSVYAFYCEGAALSIVDVSIGDVILGIGQSNMQVNVGFVFNSSAELQAANSLSSHIFIHQVSASVSAPDGPLDDFAVPPSIPWSPASNTSLGGFSATAWFTAKSIYETRPAEDASVVLGLVAAPWGGTPIKAHAPISVNATCGALYPGNYDCGMDHAPCNHSALFNSLQAPIAGPSGFPVASMVWFQGENDVSAQENGPDQMAAFYACELENLVPALRSIYNAPAAHWTTIQLAPYTGGSPLAPFREMQCRTTYNKITNASCAVLVDDGDVLSPIGTVHSRNKQLVGRRVAPGIVEALYGVPQPTMGRGPTFASHALASAPDGTLSANVSFVPATLGGAGFAYSPPHATTWSNSSRCPTELGIIRTQDCDWYNILGSDGLAYNASVTVDGSNLILAAVAPAGVTAVGSRYGYAAWPVVNYYSLVSGLPMVPWNQTALDDAAALRLHN